MPSGFIISKSRSTHKSQRMAVEYCMKARKTKKLTNMLKPHEVLSVRGVGRDLSSDRISAPSAPCVAGKFSALVANLISYYSENGIHQKEIDCQHTPSSKILNQSPEPS